MKFHIVQVNEKIKDISRKYNVSVDEIIKLNRHINNIDNIVAGMKLRLPILSDDVSDQLKDNFLDIEKYYPKLEDFKEAKVEKKVVEEILEDDAEGPQINVIPQQPVNQYQYNMPQPGYYQQPGYNPNYPYMQQYQQPVYPQQYQQPIYPQQYQQPNYPQMNVQPQQYQQPNYPQMNYNQTPFIRQNESEQVNDKNDKLEVEEPKVTGESQPIIREKENVHINVKKDTPVVEQPKVKTDNQPCYYQPVYPQMNVPNQTQQYQQPVYLEKVQKPEVINEEKRKPYPFNEEIEQPKVTVDKKIGYENYPSINQPYYYQQINSQVLPPKDLNSIQKSKEVFEYDEKVKEIKLDLREFVKHTKIRKKPKDPLDFL
ncbi:MAG: hypothetical protein K0Q49_1847 [Haloplasmataceae bacterium]|nr:hypothetical protein [Haloplasmataceae bacterium]